MPERERIKILAVKLRAIGDTVLWTSALRSLRNAYPNAEIHTLTYDTNAAILKSHPDVHVQHHVSKSKLDLIMKLWSFRKYKFEWFLGFHATTSLCRWAWLAGARHLVLHHHSWKYTPKGSLPVPHAGELEDVITRDHRVLNAMGLATPTHPPTTLRVTAGETELAESTMRLAIEKCGGNPRLPRYLFLPGGSYNLKRYPLEKWMPLAKQIRKGHIFQPVVVVDRALSEELNLRAQCAEAGIPVFDEGSLRESMALISLGTRALSNDSAPGHIAVALGVSTSFAFGPGCIGDFHPYDRKEHPLFRIDVDCRSEGPRDKDAFQYCTVTKCSHHRCMRQLDVVVTDRIAP